jgi:hypothetical protein
VLIQDATFRNTIGYPIAGIWVRPMRIHDDNRDGIITPAEVDLASDSVYVGSSIPTRELGLTSTTAWRRVTLGVTLDYRGGFRTTNATEYERCQLNICEALYDPNASLEDQARAVATRNAGIGFVEDASFLRVREAHLTWKILPGWAYRHGFARFDATLAGRNLLTLTGYSGLDPEVSFRGQDGLGSGEYYNVSLPRTLLVRLDLTR